MKQVTLPAPAPCSPGIPSRCPPHGCAELLSKYEQYALRVRSVDPETVREQRTYLRRFVDATGVNTAGELVDWLGAGTVQRFVFDYARTRPQGSCAWMQFSLRSFLKFCYLHDYTDRDLSVAVPARRRRHLADVPRGIDSQSITELRNSIRGESDADVRDAAMICLLDTYGVRGVQIRRLRLDHIHWAERRICFPAAKGGRKVEAPLTTDAGNRLLSYIRDARPQVTHPEVFLTLHPPAHPIRSASQLSSIVRRRLAKANIQLPAGVSHGTHSFRHAFGSRFVGKVPFKHLADMLGHRDPSTTLIYSKVDFAALAQAALSSDNWTFSSTTITSGQLLVGLGGDAFCFREGV